mmetsp:Transcript_21707/g.54618  ORF Transcript_21707/g.54618 Transcript_21707/m.54618 type:complete len:297 (-) Transcript_21707:47-937(-)
MQYGEAVGAAHVLAGDHVRGCMDGRQVQSPAAGGLCRLHCELGRAGTAGPVTCALCQVAQLLVLIADRAAVHERTRAALAGAAVLPLLCREITAVEQTLAHGTVVCLVLQAHATEDAPIRQRVHKLCATEHIAAESAPARLAVLHALLAARRTPLHPLICGEVFPLLPQVTGGARARILLKAFAASQAAVPKVVVVSRLHIELAPPTQRQRILRHTPTAPRVPVLVELAGRKVRHMLLLPARVALMVHPVAARCAPMHCTNTHHESGGPVPNSGPGMRVSVGCSAPSPPGLCNSAE